MCVAILITYDFYFIYQSGKKFSPTRIVVKTFPDKVEEEFSKYMYLLPKENLIDAYFIERLF